MEDVMDKPTTSPISTRKHGDVLIVLSNNPPVNALGGAVRKGLVDAIEQAEADESVKAVVIAAVGSLALFALGALLSSSAGLVFVAGLTGAGVGLVLARASAPGGGHEPALTRGTTIRLAIGVSILAVIVAAVGTWLHALGEGGALGLLDYLLETFGLTVPLELLIATLAAAWGASAGPVQR